MGALIPMPGAATPLERILCRFDRAQLEGFIAIAIDLLDLADGDSDVELNGDERDDDGDTKDTSFAEWHTRGRHKLARAHFEPAANALTHEDDEDDDPDTGVEDGPRGFDPEEDCCPAGDDRIASGSAPGGITGPLDQGAGDPEDAEHNQMADDVPCVPTVSLEYDALTDRRTPLGLTNLMSSFVVTGDGVTSADSGKRHRNAGWSNNLGKPV